MPAHRLPKRMINAVVNEDYTLQILMDIEGAFSVGRLRPVDMHESAERHSAR